jgi:anti-anti-sigma factor
MDRLRVEFEGEEGGRVRLRVSGRLERAAAAVLDGVLRALSDDPRPMIVDLTDVDHIDSHGLEALLDARARSASVEVVGVRESLRPRGSPLEH